VTINISICICILKVTKETSEITAVGLSIGRILFYRCQGQSNSDTAIKELLQYSTSWQFGA